MKYSLVSREVIADSIETVAGCEGFDGIVASVAATRICRLHHGPGAAQSPSVFIYGGTILPGNFGANRLTSFPSLKRRPTRQQKISDKELPAGSCAIPAPAPAVDVHSEHNGSAIEALGMSLSTARPRPRFRRKTQRCEPRR